MSSFPAYFEIQMSLGYGITSKSQEVRDGAHPAAAEGGRTGGGGSGAVPRGEECVDDVGGLWAVSFLLFCGSVFLEVWKGSVSWVWKRRVG